MKADYIGTNEFKFTMPIEKAFQKDVDGEPRLYVAGLASGTTVDYDEERMADSAIDAFQKAIEEGIVLPPNNVWSLIPLRSGHRKEWDDILGWVVKAEVDDKKQLWIEAELANTSAARDLYTVLTEPQRHGRPIQLGFSVGGKIKKASREWNQERNKSIRVLEEIALGEISVTGRPAFPPSYVEALTKSVDWESVPPPQQEIVANPALKESLMEKAENPVVQDQTAAANPADNTQNANAQNASEVSVTDPQQNPASQQNPVTVQNAPAQNNEQQPAASDNAANPAIANAVAAQNGDLAAQVQDLTAKVDALTTRFTQFAEVQNVSDKSVTTQTEVTKTESTEEKLAGIFAAALATFKTETIDPLVADITAMKSAVTEMSQQPVDKSLSVRKAKEVESALEKFTNEVNTNKNVSPIGAAVRLAMGE